MSARIAIMLTFILFACAAGCERRKWKECRAVGHSFAYCLGKVGD